MNTQNNEVIQRTIDENFPLALPKGAILAGQYTIDKVLGQGGFGITYMATDYKTKQKVAVKEFFPDSLAYREMTTVISYPGERAENYEYGKENFLQEAKTLAEFIGCESIVRIFSYFEENGTAYFVMEYVDGVSFDNYLNDKGGRISFEEAERILVPIMDALAIVHSKGIVHRDVTPDNIYITNDGAVKLLDFGAARYSLGDKSKSLDVILKHGFAPKEQYTRRGKQGPFTDIYSLGATFYFSITGRRPPDSIDRMEEDELIPPSNLGVKITDYQEEAILHALEVNPQSRYQSMLDFKNALLNESASAPQSIQVSQQFFNAPPAPAAMPEQQLPYTSQQPYTTVSQMPHSVSEQQTENVSKQIGEAAKQLGSAAVQLGGGVAKQLGHTAKQLGENAAKHMNSAAKQLSQTAAMVNDKQGDTVTSTESKIVQNGEAVIPKKRGISQKIIILFVVLAAIGVFLLLRGGFNGKNNWINGNPVLIGETSGNIQNGGIVTMAENGDYYFITYDGNSIKKNGNSSEIFLQSKNKTYSNLIYADNGMYYVEDGRICYYDFDNEKSEIFSKLKKYKGSDLQLYISSDYYFVYVNGKLHRIAKDKGKEEESISIESTEKFALCGNYLYYIGKDSEHENIVFKVSATDFNQSYNTVYKNDSNQYFSSITSDGENIYTLAKSYNDSDYLFFDIFDSNLERVFFFDLTKTAKDLASNDKYRIVGFNAVSNYISLTVLCNNADYNMYFIRFTQNDNTKELKTTPYIYNCNEKTYCYYSNGDCKVCYYDKNENGELYNYKISD